MVDLLPHRHPARPAAESAHQGFRARVAFCRDVVLAVDLGDAADAVFFIQSGKIKLTVVSTRGKEAVIGVLEKGSFFGEGLFAPLLAADREPQRIPRPDQPGRQRQRTPP